MPDLLLELFSEDIPARMQPRAAEDLKRLVTEGLVEAGLTYAHATAMATPRRLALAVEGLDAASRPVREERKGPRADAPAAAIEGFLRSTGLARHALDEREVGRARVLFAVIERPGRPAAAIVAEVVERVVRAFPWPKSMRWGAGSLRWVRPLRRILCLLTGPAGAETVPLHIDGIAAADLTEGHRFMAPGAFAVTSFEEYGARLKRAFVLLDPAERAAAIRADAESLAFARGLTLVPDEGLLAEVAGLVEWPVVLMGRIEDRFLHLPPEVLQTSMREHQKFFSVRNPATGRIEGFVTVANRETADQGATILAGNQKVLAARLSDAAFFWARDLAEAKTGMESWAAGLASVTFHARLGTQAARIARIAALARAIAPAVGADPDLAERAAQIAKRDLRSAMVGEFPELQGVMGRYYAQAAGEDPAVADAARDHYAPLGPSDAVPSAPVSVAVALADKLDTLTGFWAIDEKPTGSKDPFALRRAALGVIRIILGNGLRLSVGRFADVQVLRHRIGAAPENADRLAELLQTAAAEGMFAARTRALVAAAPDTAWLPLIRDHDPSVSDNLRDFLHDRLKVFLRDEGIRHDVIDASLAMEGNCDLAQLVARARALQATLNTDDGANLIQGFRRANNILTQAETQDGVEYSYGPDPKFAEDPAETALFAALDTAASAIAPALQAGDFAAAMAAMAALRAPVDAFFTAVQVNTANAVVRRNRLNLLHRIRRLCLSVADLSKIEG
jgi:glycyl-tRNA synthetase beta chain